MKKIQIFTLLMMGLLLAPKLQAQQKVNTSSIYHTVNSFFANMQDDNFRPQEAAKTFNAGNLSEEKKKELAIDLLQVFDGRGLHILVEALPRNPDYRDSIRGAQKFILFERFPEIYLEKVGQQWLFSAETVYNIDRLHGELYPFGMDKLIDRLPNEANKKFLGLRIWQYVGIGILFTLSLIIHKLLTLFFEAVILRFVSKLSRGQAVKELVEKIARPASLFMLFFVVQGLLPLLQLPALISRYALMSINIIQPIFLGIMGVKVVDFLGYYLKKMAERTDTTLDDQLVPLITKGAKVIVVILSSIYVMQSMEFNITAIITGLSIGTLAFALAAQDTIRNLFGSLTIFLDRPFQIGDWVVGTGFEGTVEEVGFRATRVRTFYNSLVYVPNGKLTDMIIDNMGARVFRRYRAMLAITYDTPPELIEAFCEGLREIVQKHPDTRKDAFFIYMHEMGSASLNILFQIFFKVKTFPEEFQARHEIILQTLHLAKALGVRFAFPTQTIHIEEMPEKKSGTPVYDDEYLSKAQLDGRLRQFFDNKKPQA
jgi:MscS family membrane protein